MIRGECTDMRRVVKSVMFEYKQRCMYDFDAGYEVGSVRCE